MFRNIRLCLSFSVKTENVSKPIFALCKFKKASSSLCAIAGQICNCRVSFYGPLRCGGPFSAYKDNGSQRLSVHSKYVPLKKLTYEIRLTVKPHIRRTLLGKKLVDHSDVGGAPPAGAAPTASAFSI